MQAQQQKKSHSVNQNSKISVSSFIQDFFEGNPYTHSKKINALFKTQSKKLQNKVFKPIKLIHPARTAIQSNKNNSTTYYHKQRQNFFGQHQKTTTASSYLRTEPAVKITGYQVQQSFHRPALSQRIQVSRDSSSQSRLETKQTLMHQQEQDDDKLNPIRISNLLFSDLKEKNKIGDWHFIHHLREKAIPLNQKLPDWFASRKDFLIYAIIYDNRSFVQEKVTIIDNCLLTLDISSYKRTTQEKQYIINYLSGLYLFRECAPSFMEEISSKIDYMHFPANSTLYEDEEFYGSLYIVYQGEIDCYNAENKLIDTFLTDQIFKKQKTEFEQSHEKLSFIAKVETHLLVIKKYIYDQAFSVQKLYSNLTDNLLIQQFLKQISLFSNLSTHQIADFSKNLQVRIYLKREYLYKHGEQIEQIFIVRSGMFVNNTIVNLVQSNYWPEKKPNERKIIRKQLKITKTVVYPLKYTSQKILGLEEALYGNPRKETVEALEDSIVFCFTKLKLLDIFGNVNNKDLKELLLNSGAPLQNEQIEKLLNNDIKQSKLKENLFSEALTFPIRQFNPANTSYYELAQKEKKYIQWRNYIKNKYNQEKNNQLKVLNVQKSVEFYYSQ